MSDIRELTWSDVDTDATLKVDDSLTSGKSIVVGGFGLVRTGFGQRLTVPLTDEQMDDDPGSFIELTYEQALDLSAKLATKLAELGRRKRES